MPLFLSLTYRPPTGTLIPIGDFQTILTSKKVLKYYIGAEKAQAEAINHYQCWLSTTYSRPDNFRTAISKSLPEVTNVSLKIESIKPDDVEYVLGYCQKEQLDHRTNVMKEELDKAKTSYQNRLIVKSKAVKEKSSLGVDQIYRMLKEEHIQKGLKHFDSKIYEQFMRIYDEEISFSTYQRIRKDSLIERLNITLG